MHAAKETNSPEYYAEHGLIVYYNQHEWKHFISWDSPAVIEYWQRESRPDMTTQNFFNKYHVHVEVGPDELVLMSEAGFREIMPELAEKLWGR